MTATTTTIPIFANGHESAEAEDYRLRCRETIA